MDIHVPFPEKYKIEKLIDKKMKIWPFSYAFKVTNFYIIVNVLAMKSNDLYSNKRNIFLSEIFSKLYVEPYSFYASHVAFPEGRMPSV